MIAWEPQTEDSPWHLTHDRDRVSLCDVPVEGCSRHDPHGAAGRLCAECLMEWRLQTAASYARMDQHFADKDAP